jgi:regulatory protein
VPTEESEGPFRDAEAWLAERGIGRDPIRVPRDQATAAPREPRGAEAPVRATRSGPREPQLEDDVAEAVAYARRATSRTPLAEGRLRRKLEERRYPDAVVVQSLRRCRSEGIVDDQALARALLEEARAKGHAPLRIRTDLARRELPEDLIDEVLAEIGDRDEEAAAYDVAVRRAQQLRGVDPETAFRRLVGYLARRGYTDAVSRKVARQAVFNDREPQRSAER